MSLLKLKVIYYYIYVIVYGDLPHLFKVLGRTRVQLFHRIRVFDLVWLRFGLDFERTLVNFLQVANHLGLFRLTRIHTAFFAVLVVEKNVRFHASRTLANVVRLEAFWTFLLAVESGLFQNLLTLGPYILRRLEFISNYLARLVRKVGRLFLVVDWFKNQFFILLPFSHVL